MDFILRYEDAKAKYDQLVRTADWSVEKNGDSTLKRLCRRLQKDGLLTGQREQFNYFSLPKDDFTLQDLKGYQIDGEVVRPEWVPPFDGLSAALGKFELLLFAAGAIEPTGLEGLYRIEVHQTGVLAEDQYDFEDFQILGFWDIEEHYGNNVFSLSHPLACPMTNGDFNEWRIKTNLGRDYWIYSDLKIADVRPIATFYCAPPIP